MDIEENKSEYGEIDLINYIRVVRRKKHIVFILFLAGLLVGWGFYFLLPRNYKAETILEIGSFSEESKDVLIYKLLEEPAQTAEKVLQGFYGDYSGLGAVALKNTNLIKIEVSKEKQEDSEQILNIIRNKILDEHNKKLEFQKERAEKKKSGYSELIESLKKNISNVERDISIFVFQDQQIAALQAKIYDFQLSIFQLQLNIKKIQKQIEDFQPTKAVGEVIISQKEPNLILSLGAGGILGIFLGIIFIFIKEWWEENKKRI